MEYNIYDRKSGILILRLKFFDKKVALKIIKNLRRYKQINISEVSYEKERY